MLIQPMLPDLIPDEIEEIVNFWADPFGNMYDAGRTALVDMSSQMIEKVVDLTLPDLTLQAFLETYAVSFALSLFVAVLLLIVQLVRMAKSHQSVRDTLESISVYFPLFILGIMFGPAIGIILVDFAHALSNVMIGFAYNGSVDAMITAFEEIFPEDPALVLGGAPVAWGLVWVQVLGALLLAVFLIAQMVTLYFSGVLIPLSAVLVIDAARRSSGVVAVTIWVGILFVHPLLFLLQGLAFRLMISQISEWSDDLWVNLVNVLIALCAQWLAILAPFLLVPYIKKMADGSGNTSSGMGAAAGAAIGAGSLAGAGARGVRHMAGRSGGSHRQPVRTHAVPSGDGTRAAGGTPGIGKRSLSTAARTAARREKTLGAAAGKTAATRVNPVVGGAATVAQMGKDAIRKNDENMNTSAIKPSEGRVGKDRPA